MVIKFWPYAMIHVTRYDVKSINPSIRQLEREVPRTPPTPESDSTYSSMQSDQGSIKNDSSTRDYS